MKQINKYLTIVFVCSFLGCFPLDLTYAAISSPLNVRFQSLAFSMPQVLGGMSGNLAFRSVEVSESDSEVIIDLNNGVVIYVLKNGHLKVSFNNEFLSKGDELSSLPFVYTTKNDFIASEEFVANTTTISSYNAEIDVNKYGYTYSYIKKEINGNEVSVSFKSENDAVEIVVKIIPATFNILGFNWYGYGVSYEIVKSPNQIVYLDCSNVWNMGGNVTSHYTWFHSPYSGKRGFGKYYLETNSTLPGSIYDNIFSAGQPFNIVVGDSNSSISFFSEPYVISNSISCSDSNFIERYRYKLGIADIGSTMPINYNLFLEKKLEDKDYTKLSFSINKWLRSQVGLSDMKREPTAGASKASQIKYVSNWDDYAKKIIPKVKELNFKRVWVGHDPSKQQFNFEYDNRDKAFADVKKFCDIARAENIDTVMWFETCTSNVNSKLVSEHPEWVVMQPDNIAPHYAGADDLLLISMNDAYLSWLFSNIKDLRQNTGLSGVWFDSFELATKLLQFTDRRPHGNYGKMIDLVKNINSLGMYVYGESMSPYVDSSFWVRKDYYSSYDNLEYGIVGTSPYTNRPDSDFINYFLAASYKSFPIIDIHPYIDNVVVYENQNQFFELIKNTNGAVNFINDKLGYGSELQISSYGPLWVSSTGYAIFFDRDIGTISLPTRDGLKVSIFPCVQDGSAEPKIEGITLETVTISDLKKYTVVILYE